MTQSTRHYPWILWPFVALWDLLTFVLRLGGRFVAALLGLVVMIVGFVISLTVVGAPLGVPLIVLGFLLMLRSIF
jgi:hypothetical protein